MTFFDDVSKREFNKITSNVLDDSFYGTPSKVFPILDKALKNIKMTLFINHADKIVPNEDISSLSFEERIALIWLCEWSLSEKFQVAVVQYF